MKFFQHFYSQKSFLETKVPKNEPFFLVACFLIAFTPFCFFSSGLNEHQDINLVCNCLNFILGHKL